MRPRARVDERGVTLTESAQRSKLKKESKDMSWNPAAEPECTSPQATSNVELTIIARARDIGGLSVRRVLPSRMRRTVGPFIFLDHMGPIEFGPRSGIDVLPHPHIGLATVTYLFEGEILHRDSTGAEQRIRPGEVNWMNAGRGIVHSERTPDELRLTGQRLHGLQLWVALPRADEDGSPAFTHYAAEVLPRVTIDGVDVCILAGEALGRRSPVKTASRLLYVDVVLPNGKEVAVPHERERAAYVVHGKVSCGEQVAVGGQLWIFQPGADVNLRAEEDSRLVFIGGDPLDGPRHLYWNFVSSSRETLERAKREWRERRFPVVPGDEQAFVPLPDEGPSVRHSG